MGHWLARWAITYSLGTCHNISQHVTRQVSMTSSSCEADVHNWDDRKDDLSGALDHAEKAALTGRNGSEH